MKIRCSKYNIIKFIILFSCSICLCLYVITEKNHLPKPYGFSRIILPNSEYTLLSKKYPYSFEISKHANVVEESKSEYGPYCITIVYPDFNAVIQITYKNFGGNKDTLRRLIKASKSLAYKHQDQAYEIKEYLYKPKNSMPVVITELFGRIPTQMQFYTTDLRTHFIRGALYFESSTENDYLEPIINFIKKDILHLLNTFEWIE